MDKLSVHQRKSCKQAKSKKKPIKVVYISNPMKVNTSASEFRALVQELTGQESDLAETTRFSNTSHHEVCGLQTVPDHGVVKEVQTGMMNPHRDSYWSFDSHFEPLEDVFNSQILENFNGFYPSTLMCDAHHQVVDVQKP